MSLVPVILNWWTTSVGGSKGRKGGRWSDRCVESRRIGVTVIEVLFGAAQKLAKELDEDAHDGV